MASRFIPDPGAHLRDALRRQRQYSRKGRILNRIEDHRNSYRESLKVFSGVKPSEAFYLLVGSVWLLICELPYQFLLRFHVLQVGWRESKRERRIERRLPWFDRRERTLVLLLTIISLVLLYIFR